MLTSSSEKIKRLRKLVERANFRSSERAFVIEGPNAFEALLRSGYDIEALFYSQDLNSNHRSLISHAFERGISVFEVSEGVLESVMDLVNAQPIVAIAPIPTLRDPSLLKSNPVLLLDELRDPGNAGTIIRSAHATGVCDIYFLPGCVDPYNPKTVRASVGSIFFVNCYVGLSKINAVSQLKLAGYKVFYASSEDTEGSHKAVIHTDLDFKENIAIVIGNEATGVSDEMMVICDGAVTIPTLGSLESLNASMAATVLLFESWRQRGMRLST